jgi:hypothetical protein
VRRRLHARTRPHHCRPLNLITPCSDLHPFAPRYRGFFINLMMTEELSLPLPSEVAPSILGSCVIMGGFVGCGLLPPALLAAVHLLTSHSTADAMLAFVVLALTTFALGGFKAHMIGGGERPWVAGSKALLLGAVCVVAAWRCSQTFAAW